MRVNKQKEKTKCMAYTCGKAIQPCLQLASVSHKKTGRAPLLASFESAYGELVNTQILRCRAGRKVCPFFVSLFLSPDAGYLMFLTCLWPTSGRLTTCILKLSTQVLKILRQFEIFRDDFL